MMNLEELAEKVGSTLAGHGWMLVAAESCTGGWVAQKVTDIAGSSAWFDRGFVTYSNESKQDMLGVPEQLLRSHGAVSEPVVLAMLAGALNKSRAQVGVAISGIAGPGGGTPDKPVGTVWFAWGIRGGRTRSGVEHFSGDRRAVRERAVAQALLGILDLVHESVQEKR